MRIRSVIVATLTAGGTVSGEVAAPSAPSDAAPSGGGALGALLLGGMLGLVVGGGLAATTLRGRRPAAEPS